MEGREYRCCRNRKFGVWGVSRQMVIEDVEWLRYEPWIWATNGRGDAKTCTVGPRVDSLDGCLSTAIIDVHTFNQVNQGWSILMT